MELLFPSNIYCIVCGCMIDSSRPYALCDQCMRKIHWIDGVSQKVCEKCGKPLGNAFHSDLCYDCMGSHRYFHKGFSCMEYGMYEREIMMGIKYSGKGYMAYKMGDVMFDRLWPEYVSGNLEADLVVPVPVSSRRMQKRGYNQVALLARQLIKRWNTEDKSVKLEEKVLERCKSTQMLRSLNPAEREMVLRGAFSVKNSELSKITDKNILLIDDIYTTGATANACSRALLEAGAARVYFASLATGSNRRPTYIDQ